MLISFKLKLDKYLLIFFRFVLMSKKKKAKDDEKLEGFDIKVNEFGEITSNLPIDALNKFLDENLEDKKLKAQKSEEE